MDDWKAFCQSGKIQDYLKYRQYQEKEQPKEVINIEIQSVQGGGKADEFNG